MDGIFLIYAVARSFVNISTVLVHPTADGNYIICLLQCRCISGSTCVSWDKEGWNPWGYNGVCIPDNLLTDQCTDFEKFKKPVGISKKEQLQTTLEELLKKLPVP